MKKNYLYLLLIALLVLAVALLAACDSGKPNVEQPQPVILEPGVGEVTPVVSTPAQDTPEDVPEELPEEQSDFVDQGRATTIDDLMANKALIQSYYFEQVISYTAGEIYINTWYKDGVMKIESSFAGGEKTIDFYDCEENILINYTPSYGPAALMIKYEEGDPELPDNPLDYNYHEFRVLDTESIDGQVCRVLENRQGDKLWVGTKYGFPVQVEFTDILADEHLVVAYQNIVVNQVSSADVAMPDNLEIYAMDSAMGPEPQPDPVSEEPAEELS